MKPFLSRRFGGSRLTAALCGATALFLFTVAVSAYHEAGRITLGVLSAAMGTFLYSLGLISALSTRVEVKEEQLIICENLRTRIYARSEFKSVSWAKGCPVTLERHIGGNITLPPLSTST